MNKEDLINLKENLTKVTKTKKFGYFCQSEDDVDPDLVKPVDEILSEVNTQQAIEKIELLLEDYINELINHGIDFDIIKLSIMPDLFASEFFINKCANDEKFNENRSIKKEDVLYDIIPLSVSLDTYIYEENKPKLNLDSEHIYPGIMSIGPVKYNEFVKGLESLGYDSSFKTFDEYFNNVCNSCNCSEVIIDFSKEKKHTH